LKRAVADLTLDNQILREAAEGNFYARIPSTSDSSNTNTANECHVATLRLGKVPRIRIAPVS
ncbi:MAG: hypothetical protein QGH15_21520, partial [Kiritimatiellia bacterium]|nr:hypothetical protein [Kiritimatiellia bacterium]